MIDLDDVLAHAHDNCVACEGTGVVRCWSPGGPCPDGQTVCESCGPCQQSDIPALVAALREARAEVERLTADAGKRLSWAIFAVRDHDAYAQPFVLVRDTDVSGISGTGIVADGAAFPDGTVALRWRGGNPTSVVFHDNGVESVEVIHGHGGATRLVWLAEDLETTAEVAATYDERDDWRRRYEALRDGVLNMPPITDAYIDFGRQYQQALRAVVARVEGDES